MKKIVFISVALVLAFLTLAAKNSFAQYGCNGQYGQYGGCPPTHSIFMNKLVGKITSSTTIEYVDNLSPADTRFRGGDFVFFQLKVKNTSNVTQTNVKTVDNVPSYLDPVEGPGEFDANTRTVTFFIPELKVNEEKVYVVKMQVKPTAQLNAMNDGACEVNKASASINSAFSEDTAQFCVEKQVLGVTQVPSTGPEHWIAALIASVTALGIGVALKTKAKYS